MEPSPLAHKQMLAASPAVKRIAVIDMDNTLLRDSFIYYAAHQFGFEAELREIVKAQPNPFIRTRQIARLLKHQTISDLLKAYERIPLTENIQSLVAVLKSSGFSVGIISDSYDCIVNHLKNRFLFDFSIGNQLEFSGNIATGEVRISSFFLPHAGSICTHGYCKTHAMTRVCQKLGISPADSLAIGDGENDICMLRESGTGISFCSTSKLVDDVADVIIKEPDFTPLASIIGVRFNQRLSCS